MATTNLKIALTRQGLCFCVFISATYVLSETIRYSIPEEMENGSVVANVAKDLGLDLRKLSGRGARIVSEDSKQHFQFEPNTGALLIKDQIDREEICRKIVVCTVHFQLLLENPLKFFRVEVEIYDINDHLPVFSEDKLILNIPETIEPGSRFPLEGAQDFDVGSNSLQNYTIIPPNEYFNVYFQNKNDSDKYLELVLEKSLDREEQPEINFILTAIDGGSPPRSGTTQIRIMVLDVNDNAPIFTRELYKVKILENSPEDSIVVTVIATDLDKGLNGEIAYSFSQNAGKSHSAFKINPLSGEIRIVKPLDFEFTEKYEIGVRATDGGGLSALCKVLVEVLDVNDNPPEVTINSLMSLIPENSSPETVVALFNIKDLDSGENGRTTCSIDDQLPFALKPAFKNYYELVTEKPLDREKDSQYVITITATDSGSPSLTVTEAITVQISDINDNAPLFNQAFYTMYVNENNNPGALIGTVTAVDQDLGQNANVKYSILLARKADQSLYSYISINSENGNIYVLRPLDYELVTNIDVLVQASDFGSPRLSTNVTVHVIIIDENDNSPVILFPSQNSSSASVDLAPRTAEAGYLVSKVVAVDGDSGQNSWLSYQLFGATDPGLFMVGLQNGEIRSTRPITDRDSFRQKLTILVNDNGRPPLSTTAVLNILLVEGFSDAHMPLDSTQEEENGSTLTMYLAISLALISFLFLVALMIIIVKLCNTKQSKENYMSTSGMIYGDCNFPSNLVDVNDTGILSHAYRYEVCLTTGSGNSEFKFLKPLIPSLRAQHCNIEGNVEREAGFQNILNPSKEVDPENQMNIR